MSEAEILHTAVGPCLVKRSNRKTLAISVLPDGSIELTAPLGASLDDVAARVKRRSGWVERQQRAFTGMNTTGSPLRYCSGATHRYLGRQYRLKIRKGNRAGVKLRGAYFEITTPDLWQEAVQVLLAAWMRTHAEQHFSKRLTAWKPWCEYRKLPEPRLYLRAMPKRWGSSHRDGRIYLNPDLVRAPSVCVDYVIVHEICHLQHPKHNRFFYELLSEMFPDWQVVKLRLEQAEL